MAALRREDPLRPLITVVPSGIMARTLQRTVLRAPLLGIHIVPLDRYLRQGLPPDVPCLPPEFIGVFASHLRLSRWGLPDDVPGLDHALARAIWECRLAGLTSQDLARAEIPWAQALDAWQTAAGDALDERRIYEYALNSGDAQNPREFYFFGFVDVNASQETWFDHMARAARTVGWVPLVGSPSDRYSEPWRQHWRRLGWREEPVEASGAPEQGPILAWVAPDPEAVAEWAVRAVNGRDPAAVRLVERAARHRGSLARVARIHQVPLVGRELTPPGGEDAGRWAIFWKVARGEASRSEERNWRQGGFPEAQPAARAARLARRMLEAPTWADAADALMETLEWHGWATESVRAHWERFALFDRLGLAPRRNVLEAMLAQPWGGVVDPSEGAGMRVMAALEARHDVAPLTVLLGVGDGEFPAAPAPDPLLGPYRRRLGLFGVQRRALEERHLLEWIMAGSRQVIWIGIGEAGGVRWPHGFQGRLKLCAEAALPGLPLESPPEASRVRSWWQSQELPVWGPFDGMAGAPVLPEDRTLSVSDVERFGRCPLQYFFARGLGLPEMETSDDGLSGQEARLGQWVHGVLERVYRDRAGFFSRTPHGKRAWLREAFAAAAKQLPWTGAPQFLVETVLNRLVDDLSGALAQDDVLPDATVATEAPLLWTEVLTEGPWRFRARLDRVDWHGATAHIIDYKTGAVPDPDRMGPGNLQLGMYRVGLSRMQGIDLGQIQAEYRGVSRSNGFRRRLMELDPLTTEARVRAILEGVLQRMTEGRFHPIPHGQEAPCRSCGYRLLCPARVAESAPRKSAADPDYLGLWQQPGEAVEADPA